MRFGGSAGVAACVFVAIAACGGNGPGADDDAIGDDQSPIDAQCDASSFFADVDGDGWGSPRDMVMACDPPPNSVREAGDCDDNDGTVHPGAPDVCNAVDDDCDTLTGDGIDECGTWEGCINSECVAPSWANAVGSGIADYFMAARVSSNGRIVVGGATNGSGRRLHRRSQRGRPVAFSATLGGDGYDSAYGVATSADGSSVYVCGETRSGGNALGRMLVARFGTQASSETWARELEYEEDRSAAFDCSVTQNGDVVVAGQMYRANMYYGPVVRFRSDGVISWIRSFSGFFPRVVAADGDSAYVGGTIDGGVAALGRVSAAGVLEWIVRFNAGQTGSLLM